MCKYIRTYTQIQPTDSAFVSIWFYQLPLEQPARGSSSGEVMSQWWFEEQSL